MATEVDFLDRLLETPSDDTTRLVYADWLDEQGNSVSSAKAEFLRLTVQLASSTGKKGQKKVLRKLLQQRAAALDTDWLAVVSKLPLENCYFERTAAESRRLRLPHFDLLCARRWEELQPTKDHAVRFCGDCRQNVHYCDTIMEARRHAWEGHCVAVDLGVIRREGDIAPREPQRLLGRVAPTALLRREEQRMKPDPVSAQREQRKRENTESKE